MRKLLLLLGVLVGSASCANSKYPKTDHYNGREFYNPWLLQTKGFSDFLKWQWSREQVAWPEFVDDNVKAELTQPMEEGVIQLTFVNHASFYVQTKSLAVLTDPVFSERVSPVSFAGPKRVRKVGVEIAELPKLDVVLISHSHYDHLDTESVKNIAEKFDPLFIVPLGVQKLVESYGAKRVVELDWWQTQSVGDSQKVHLVPAQHWSARGIFDRNETLWGGFVIESDRMKIYFSGDTGYGPHFAEIQKRWNEFDLSILPIGAYEPRWFMKDQHMNPEDAVLAHKDVNSRLSIGCHFGTFQLTDEGIEQPVIDLNEAKQKYGIQAQQFLALKNGESRTIRKQ